MSLTPAGVLTIPNQPIFRFVSGNAGVVNLQYTRGQNLGSNVARATTVSGTSSGDSTNGWICSNNPTSWNQSSGVFTCSSAGNYSLSLFLMIIGCNANTRVQMSWGNNTHYIFSSSSGMLLGESSKSYNYTNYLNVGDTVFFTVVSSSTAITANPSITLTYGTNLFSNLTLIKLS